ncbi:kinase-like protein [Sistotremastrum niveocremeum HHB9708]|uniref:Kinase-like protein n=1 Tax=Sistotremastrum niveocremeum HHB9708 TaxID=1314777 RepID=A0A164NXH4_9AGAM|nr:kinase-like protein [Sistotremastrum niveocremeum HHB9708]
MNPFSLSCVALKFSAARLTGQNKELSILKRLSSRNAEPEDSQGAHTIRLLDYFEVRGPNGVHEVIVTEVVLGWNEMRYSAVALPPVRKVTAELALGLAHIHNCDIVHGDLHVGNIGFRMNGFDQVDEFQVLQAIDAVTDQFCYPVISENLEMNVAGLPTYIVSSDNKIGWMAALCDVDRLTALIMDFGEAFVEPEAPSKPNIMFYLQPPELLLNLQPLSKAGDIWAFGCTVSELVLRWPLFANILNEKELLKRMVATLGPLPREWQLDNALAWLNLDDDDVQLITAGQKDQGYMLDRVALSWFRSVTEIPPSAQVIEDTQALFSMLSALLQFEPKSRPPIDEVLKHPWLRQFTTRDTAV